MAMEELLRAAGFPAVETEGDRIWARLSPSGPEFCADPAGEGWILSLSWPVRLDAAALEAWNLAHPGSILDLAGGETRLRLGAENAADLSHWRELAEAMIAGCLARRRSQREQGEGM